MTQLTDLALATMTVLFNGWALENQLDKTKIKWYAYEPTRIEIREQPISISVVYQSGTSESTSKAIDQVKDLLKIDVFVSLKNLEGDKARATGEINRMLIKDQIYELIHSNQTAVTGVKFSKVVRTARSDEVDSPIEQWFLHEILFIQAEWYHTS